MSIASSQKPPEEKEIAQRFANTLFPGIPRRPSPVGGVPQSSPAESAAASTLRKIGTHPWRCPATARVCASGKLTAEDRSLRTGKLSRRENRAVVRIVPRATPAGGRRRSCPSGRLRSRSRGSCRTGGRRAWHGSRTFRPGRSGSAVRTWIQSIPKKAPGRTPRGRPAGLISRDQTATTSRTRCRSLRRGSSRPGSSSTDSPCRRTCRSRSSRSRHRNHSRHSPRRWPPGRGPAWPRA